METFQEHYLSMKRTIAARKLNVDMALIDRAVDEIEDRRRALAGEEYDESE